MKMMSAVPLVVATVIIACSKEEPSARERQTAPRDSIGGATRVDSVASASDTLGMARAAHAQHAPPAGAGVSTHQAHAQAQRTDSAHAAHAQIKPADTTHAAHAAMKPADTTHAAHAAAKPGDTTHAAHVQPTGPDSAHAGHAGPGMPEGMHQGHGKMTMISLPRGWMAIGMAQAFPTATLAVPSDDGTPFERTGLYLTQPALMFNVESPGSRLVLRTTLNLEGLTQPAGELTFGGWGEGFIDKRHPHTYLHEAMLSLNLGQGESAGWSVSAGKGFAPYGTDDPMMRPVVKYPTNHHLSQILERWTLNGLLANERWSVEAGVFGGTEPTSPEDFSNIESFGDSWSGRITRRVGTGVMGAWPWEFAASFGRVREEHTGEAAVTRLYNIAIRREHELGTMHLYGLFEGSLSDPAEGKGFFSILGEGSLQRGRHKPYARVELATRPEWARKGPRDTRGFFRYDHDTDPIGATRWLIVTGGYGVTATTLPFSARPYVEAQLNRVGEDRGGVSPVALYGRSTFWSLSAGFRLFLGGDPMRMGAYGILDPMTMMHRMQMQMQPTSSEEVR